jgi:hypothetical protein
MDLMDDLQAITSSLLERPTEPVSIPKENGIIFDIPKEYLVMMRAFFIRKILDCFKLNFSYHSSYLKKKFTTPPKNAISNL